MGHTAVLVSDPIKWQNILEDNTVVLGILKHSF